MHFFGDGLALHELCQLSDQRVIIASVDQEMRDGDTVHSGARCDSYDRHLEERRTTLDLCNTITE